MVVTYGFPIATCVPVRTDTELPDSGCSSSIGLTVKIPVSGLPTTLGPDPGDAALRRVEFIISHTWNRDITVRLTSPSNVTRNLVVSRFGNGDNFGNPASCPGSPFRANASKVLGPLGDSRYPTLP